MYLVIGLSELRPFDLALAGAYSLVHLLAVYLKEASLQNPLLVTVLAGRKREKNQSDVGWL